jgi:uncharacterized membrane protein YdbT with pleckstrin-like domain
MSKRSKRRGPLSYVEQTLLPGEDLFALGTLHWALFVSPLLTALVFTWLWHRIAVFFSGGGPVDALWYFFFIMPWFPLLNAMIQFSSTESAITSRRVLLKKGLVSRYSDEIALSKVETVGVSQGIIGRIFGFGTVHVHGTGGKGIAIAGIKQPMQFRSILQQVLAS